MLVCFVTQQQLTDGEVGKDGRDTCEDAGRKNIMQIGYRIVGRDGGKLLLKRAAAEYCRT
jgi:hypothetical protein